MQRFLDNSIYVFGLTVAVLLLLTPAALVFGQAETAITLSKSPRFPAPQASVTVSATSRLTNLNDKQTVWYKDGEVLTSGVGIDEVTTTVGTAGETTTVSLQADTDSGTVERSIDITPTEVDLVWEAVSSYTPPFYKGKALHPGRGEVRVSAIPHIYRDDGSRYRQSGLVYTWEYNGLTYGDDSGRGQSSFSITTTPRQGNRISVSVETPSGATVGQESVTLPISRPEVLLYEQDPLLGTRLASALSGTFTLSGSNQIELVAYPYFFLASDGTVESLSYDWELNGENLQPTEQENVVRLRRQSNVSGEARVELTVEDTQRLFPSAETSLMLEF